MKEFLQNIKKTNAPNNNKNDINLTKNDWKVETVLLQPENEGIERQLWPELWLS